MSSMKSINLLSLTQAYNSLSIGTYRSFAALHRIEIKDSEVNDLRCLVENLRDEQSDSNLFDGYYVGYKIPQIGKEFDLLRFGTNYNVNIEVKSDCDEDKMRRQLLRNKYYLGYLGRPLYNVSFSSLAQKFYLLCADEALVSVDLDVIRKMLSEQEVETARSIDEKFHPSNYLVSPFNSPNRFLSSEYFLTSQQEDVKAQMMQLLARNGSTAFVSLTGAAGTGKTLLAYDIVAELIRKGRSPLIVHCGNLNGGHHVLISAGWIIIPIKEIGRYDLARFEVILIDEAQRIRLHQFSNVIKHIQQNNGKCIFSFDRSQTLADDETRNDVSAKIKAIPGVVSFALSEKIRSNKEIATFIKGFFNISRGLKTPDTGNIEVLYFGDAGAAKEYISTINESNWKVLRFTPSQYKSEHHESYSIVQSSTSHEVIGQEFDCVAVVIDKFFAYNAEGNLIYTGSAYYQPAKMLFQNITRARTKLKLIIIDNHKILDACINILQ